MESNLMLLPITTLFNKVQTLEERHAILGEMHADGVESDEITHTILINKKRN
ncbi:hypothetical protein [Nitrosomonas communis]|jgi:hypothetical protein|uniref:hypothetical protein n=1 Tax=Nitrosomonas communis TaxID=44574 RepID=UPI0015A647B8|nr:hypothetical protein [Nitrosomonas communis]